MGFEAYLFDIGNVIVIFDYSLVIRRLQPKCDKKIDDALWQEAKKIGAEMERGKVDWQEFYASITNIFAYRGQETFFKEAFCDIFTLNENMAEFIKKLKSEKRTKQARFYLLSNTSQVHINYILDKFDIFKYFNGAVYSFEVGALKPEKAIYQEAIKKFSLNPKKTFYIDDLDKNIATGRDMEFIFFLYKYNNHSDFVKFIQKKKIY